MKNVTFERKAERTNFYTQLRIFSLHDSKVWRRQCLLEQRRSITHLSPCCYICLPSVWLSWFSPGMSHHLHSVSPFRSSCLLFSEDGWVRCMFGGASCHGGEFNVRLFSRSSIFHYDLLFITSPNPSIFFWLFKTPDVQNHFHSLCRNSWALVGAPLCFGSTKMCTFEDTVSATICREDLLHFWTRLT